MKRIALLTVLLLVVGLSLGFAQEFKPAVSWTTAGTATLTWGVNLDTMETGFTNAGSAQFALTLVPAATLTKGADADVYGSITLTTTALSLFDTFANNGSAATTVAAKIVAKPFEIGVNGGPSHALGGYFTVIDSTANYTDLFSGKFLSKTETALSTSIGGPGTYVKYGSDLVDVTASLFSTDALWATRAKDTATNYGAGFDVALKVAPVTVTGGVWDTFLTGAIPTAYVGVSTAAIGPLTASAQVDLVLATTMDYDIGANIALALTKATSLTVGAQYGLNNFNGLDLRAVFATTEVAGLTETLTAYVLDVGSVSGMRLLIDNNLSYKVALSDTTSVTPAVEVQYGMNPGTTNNTGLKVVGSVAAALIPNTTITLTYTSGDFMVTPLVMGKATVAVGIAY